MSAIINVPINSFVEIKLGSQVWSGRNYDIAGGQYPNGLESLINDYGKVYTWDQAMTINYPGWHLPTLVEANTLIAYLTVGNGGTLKESGTTYWDSPNTGATNTTQFGARALPVGAIKQYSYFWLATQYDATQAYMLSLTYNSASLLVDVDPKNSFYYVRLIKN